MSLPPQPVVKRKRGRPPKNPPPHLPLPTPPESLLEDPPEASYEISLVSTGEGPRLPGYVGYDLNTPSGSFLTLQYNPRKRCLCYYHHLVRNGVKHTDKHNSSFDPSSICPYHGHDNKSKTPVRKTSIPVQTSSTKRKRTFLDEDPEDDDYEPQQRQGPSTTRARHHTPKSTSHAVRLSKGAALNESAEDPFYTPRQSQKPARAPPHKSSPPTPHKSRAEPTNPQQFQHDTYVQDLCLREAGAWRTQQSGSCSDEDLQWRSHSESETSPLTEIDFFEAPFEARKIIYRYFLVPSAKIIFPGQNSSQTFRQLNPNLRTDILFTHPMIYNECRSIFYGENNFIANDPADFFLPIGIQGLRPSTARRIKHISIVKRGGVKECDITSEEVARSLHHMTINSPAFLGLQSITIRFEVSQPSGLDLFNLQMYVNERGADVDVRSMYIKRGLVGSAAAKVAYMALKKGSPFRGLVYKESKHTVCDNEVEDQTSSVYQVCLFRSKEPESEHREEKATLRRAILTMLTDEKLRKVQGSEKRFDWYWEKCLN